MSRNVAIAAFALSLCVFGLKSNSARAQVAPVPAPTHTLWSFLGIPGGLNKVHGALFNRKGLHPLLEKKPPLKAIADPANLMSEDPALKRAAEIKAEEDKAQQKIKVIRYLAYIGCGCYDKDGSITAALIAKMEPTEECTERVRLAAVEAVEEVASGASCSRCGETCCCNEDMVKQLARVAYERDDKGCYLEPSERIREAAVRALELCCPDSSPVVEVTDENGGEVVPPETGDEVPETGEEGTEEPLDLDNSDITLPIRPAPLIDRRLYEDRAASSTTIQEPAPVRQQLDANAFTQRTEPLPERVDRPNTSRVVRYAQPSRPQPSAAENWRGVIVQVDSHQRVAEVQLQSQQLLIPEGSMLAAVQAHDGRKLLVGPFKVVRSKAGRVQVAFPQNLDAQRVRRGDVVIAAPERPQQVAQARSQPPARRISWVGKP